MSNTSDGYSEDIQRNTKILDKLMKENKMKDVSTSIGDERKLGESMKYDVQEVENHPRNIEISISSGDKIKDVVSLKSDAQAVKK